MKYVTRTPQTYLTLKVTLPTERDGSTPVYSLELGSQVHTFIWRPTKEPFAVNMEIDYSMPEVKDLNAAMLAFAAAVDAARVSS